MPFRRAQILISQPFRNTGFTHRFASRLFVNSPLALSHNNLPSKWTAAEPSTSHSVYFPAIAKFEHAGAPPLHARTQSRTCDPWLLIVLAPGERCRYGSGNLYSAQRFP